MPADALPTKDAEAPDDTDRAGRVALHQRGIEHFREHHQVALGACGPVEDHPLVAPLTRRTSQLDSPSANRRAAASG